MILLGSAVHTKGFGWLLVSATNRLMAALRDRKTPRLSRRRESFAKKPSTALSQDADVGVKWKVHRGMAVEPLAFRMLVGGVVVEDGMDRLSLRHLRLDGVEEADELLMPVALHVAANDGAIEDIEGGKQRRRAVALVVVGHRPGAPERRVALRPQSTRQAQR